MNFVSLYGAIIGLIGTVVLYLGQADPRYPAAPILWKISAALTILATVLFFVG